MQRETHTIDATEIPLGRLASKIAWLLMGKQKASYVPYKDDGSIVIIENLDKIKFTARNKKMEQKKYYRGTKRVGALKSETLRSLWERRPKEVLRRAVMGMLPKNKLRTQMIKRLEIK